MTSEATAKQKQTSGATLTALNGHGKKTVEPQKKVEPKQPDTKPVLTGRTTLCHNTAIIFSKELHATLPWHYQGKAVDKKQHIQIDIVGDRVILSSPKPEPVTAKKK